MGIIVRFFMFTYAALGLGIAVGTLLVATQALDLQFIYQQLNNYIGRWELILTATIWSILSLSLLIIAIWGKHDKAMLVQVTEYGKVHMSVEALQKLIEKYVKKIAGLHNIKSEIKHNEQLISIKIMADALPECKVAEVTKTIQENVSQGIQESIGRAVNSIEVYIQDINNQPK